MSTAEGFRTEHQFIGAEKYSNAKIIRDNQVRQKIKRCLWPLAFGLSFLTAN